MAKKNGKNNGVNLVKDGKVIKMTSETAAAATAEVSEVRATITAEAAYTLTTDQIEQGLAEGYIRWAGGIPRGEKATAGTRTTSITDVTVSADKSPTKREEAQPYEKLEALTWEGMVLLSGGRGEAVELRGDEKVDPRAPESRTKGAPDHFNYGLDLEVKRALRRDLENSLSGPDKAIEKMAKAMFDLKLAGSLEAARVKARKQYEAEIAEAAEAGA